MADDEACPTCGSRHRDKRGMTYSGACEDGWHDADAKVSPAHAEAPDPDSDKPRRGPRSTKLAAPPPAEEALKPTESGVRAAKRTVERKPRQARSRKRDRGKRNA